MKKNHLVSLLPTVGLALLVVSIPLSADTPDASAPASSPAAPSAAQVPPDLAAALQLPAGPDQNKAVGAAVKAWGQQDPKAVADWLVQQTNPRTNLQIHGFFLGWTAKDTAAAEAYSTQIQGNQDYRYIAVFSVADGLVRKRADAAAWQATLTTPDDRNAAIDGIVTMRIRGDIPSMTAWIKQLNPTDMKWAALIAARNWNPAKGGDLSAWLDQLSLSADDKAAIAKASAAKGPFPDTFHISKYQPAAAAAPAKP